MNYNETWKGRVSIKERCSYFAHPTNPMWTCFEQQAEMTLTSVPMASTCEKFMVKSYDKNTGEGRKIDIEFIKDALRDGWLDRNRARVELAVRRARGEELPAPAAPATPAAAPAAGPVVEPAAPTGKDKGADNTAVSAAVPPPPPPAAAASPPSSSGGAAAPLASTASAGPMSAEVDGLDDEVSDDDRVDEGEDSGRQGPERTLGGGGQFGSPAPVDLDYLKRYVEAALQAQLDATARRLNAPPVPSGATTATAASDGLDFSFSLDTTPSAPSAASSGASSASSGAGEGLLASPMARAAAGALVAGFAAIFAGSGAVDLAMTNKLLSLGLLLVLISGWLAFFWLLARSEAAREGYERALAEARLLAAAPAAAAAAAPAPAAPAPVQTQVVYFPLPAQYSADTPVRAPPSASSTPQQKRTKPRGAGSGGGSGAGSGAAGAVVGAGAAVVVPPSPAPSSDPAGPATAATSTTTAATTSATAASPASSAAVPPVDLASDSAAVSLELPGPAADEDYGDVSRRVTFSSSSPIEVADDDLSVVPVSALAAASASLSPGSAAAPGSASGALSSSPSRKDSIGEEDEAAQEAHVSDNDSDEDLDILSLYELEAESGAGAVQISVPASVDRFTRSEMFTVFVVDVRTSGRSWSVFRRYRDFADLNTALRKVAAGADKIPPFPKKIKTNLHLARKVENRREALSLYMKGIMRNEHLSTTEAVTDFLRPETGPSAVWDHRLPAPVRPAVNQKLIREGLLTRALSRSAWRDEFVLLLGDRMLFYEPGETKVPSSIILVGEIEAVIHLAEPVFADSTSAASVAAAAAGAAAAAATAAAQDPSANNNPTTTTSSSTPPLAAAAADGPSPAASAASAAFEPLPQEKPWSSSFCVEIRTQRRSYYVSATQAEVLREWSADVLAAVEAWKTSAATASMAALRSRAESLRQSLHEVNSAKKNLADRFILNRRRLVWQTPRGPQEASQTLLRRAMSLFAGPVAPGQAPAVIGPAMAQSVGFLQFTFATSELQAVSLASFSHDATIAFFANCYHTLLIHSFVEMGPPTPAKRKSFFANVSYEIGGRIFSLTDIEHGILRAAMSHSLMRSNKSFLNRVARASGAIDVFTSTIRRNDPRARLALKAPEPRLNFLLSTGSYSYPAEIVVMDAARVDDQLEAAARLFCAREVEIRGKKLIINRMFESNAADFGGLKGVVRTLVPWLPEASRAMLLNLLALDSAGVKVSYSEFDWSCRDRFELAKV